MHISKPLEPRLMRTMIEGVMQQRLEREREHAQRAAAADAFEAEALDARPHLGEPFPEEVAPCSALVNAGGDGNAFALFVATMLEGVGANVRITLGCGGR